MQSIELQRRFQRLTASEREDTDFLLSISALPFPGHLGWSELLEHERVILVAEGGAGKSVEMLQQKSRLAEAGRSAFFVPLDDLDRESLDDILDPQETSKFHAWKANGTDTAWFFLDAVDELRLTGGKLDRALRRLANDLHPCLGRARVVISSRPNDWRPGRDAETVKNRLPVQPKPPGPPMDYVDALEDFGEHFLALEADEAEVADDLLTVAMLPLGETQISKFATHCGVQDLDRFLAELNDKDAWSFAGRPLDLQDLVRVWQQQGSIGSRTDQLRLNVKAKLEDPDREDRGSPSDAEAFDGAARLALGLALTRTRTIRSHPTDIATDEPVASVLDARSALPDWSDAKRQSLLRRALFDPATHGRVRFHHRSAQEYLAARCLQALRERGMSTASASDLLFAERYGVPIAFPSMLPIAAWLANWDPAIRAELLARQPEALLSYGDPESLDDATRADLVRRLAADYGEHGLDGLAPPIEQVRRLATPRLDAVTREVWQSGNTSRDIRELVLKMIWLGPIPLCSDIAHDVVIDAESTDHERIVALRALVACDRDEIVRGLANDMAEQPGSWPSKVIHAVAGDLFPAFLDADQLVSLMRATPEPQNTVGGFAWAARELASMVTPNSQPAVALRCQLTDLIRRGLRKAVGPEFIEGDFDHLAPALAILCKRQLETSRGKVDPDLVRAAVVASRFGHGSLDSDRIHDLRGCFDTDPSLRRAAFRAELEFVDDVDPDTPERLRSRHAANGESLLRTITDADRAWLTEELKSSHPLNHRIAALQCLLALCALPEGGDDLLPELRRMVGHEPRLLQTIEAAAPSPEADEAAKQRDAKREQRDVERRKALEERRAVWSAWQLRAARDPAGAFSDARKLDTLDKLHRWLMQRHRYERYAVWDKPALAETFSDALAELAEREFRDLWRGTPPAPLEPGRSRQWAFLGLQAESAVPRWAEELTPSEVRTAVDYATMELGDFAPFFNDLLVSHPSMVEDVVGGRINAEVRPPIGPRHPTVLDLVAGGSDEIKRLLSPRLLRRLTAWEPTDAADEHAGLRLSKLLRVLVDTQYAADAVAAICADRYRSDPKHPLASTWLTALFRLDAKRGAEELLASLTGRSRLDDDQAQAMFAAVFDDTSDERNKFVGELTHRPGGIATLAMLVRRSRDLIRPRDDRGHVGTSTPDARYRAERARDFLVSALCGTPGLETYETILDLATRPELAGLAGRLRLAARRRAAVDAESPPYNHQVVVDLHRRFEAPPQDSPALLRTLIDRLEDFDHDLRHHDFSVRETLQRIPNEPEMQRNLADRLLQKANGAYDVIREDEVIDGKKPDIRLATIGTGQKVAVEVKMADKCTVKELREALCDQLRSQYLRHASCRCGCLLLTYQGSKRWWVDPETQKRLGFRQLLALLDDECKTLAAADTAPIHMVVHGLDLHCG